MEELVLAVAGLVGLGLGVAVLAALWKCAKAIESMDFTLRQIQDALSELLKKTTGGR
jgi:hypothetical protein